MFWYILEQMGEEKIDGEFGGYSPAVTWLVDLDLPYLGPNLSKNIAQPWW